MSDSSARLIHRVAVALGLVLGSVVAARAQALPGIQLTYVTGGFDRPVAFVQDPSAPSRQVVLEKSGHVRWLVAGIPQTTDFLDLSGALPSPGTLEQGALGFAFAPDYATSGRVFVCFTDAAGNLVVSRFLRSAVDPLLIDPTSRFDLIWPGGLSYIVQPTGSHNGGNLAFGPDGYLYVAFGDGGGIGDPPNNAQNPLSLLGKMLRLDVAVPGADLEGYDVPATNPFVAQAGVLPEIWSLGWRNPWRWSFDDPARGGTGALVVGDVGQDRWEEIDYEPAAAGGRNYGWRNREGAHDHVTTVPPFSLPTDPIYDYARGQGGSITGGFVYRGAALHPSLHGRYIFADFGSGRLMSLGLTVDSVSGEAIVANAVDHSATLGLQPQGFAWTSFGVDAAGEVYLLHFGAGAIYRLDPGPAGAAISRWAHDASGFWDDPANWAPQQVPQAGAAVFIDRPDALVTVTIRVPTETVASVATTDSLAIDSVLTISGVAELRGPVHLSGTVTGTGAVRFMADSEWSAGLINLTGGLIVNPGRRLRVTSSAAKTLEDTVLTNRGSVEWVAGVLALDGSSAVINDSTGTWDIQGNHALAGNGGVGQTFTNAGIVKKTGALGAFTVTGLEAFTSTGEIQLRLGGLAAGQHDRLDLSGVPVVLGGALTVSPTTGFTPQLGDTLAVVDFLSRTGAFASIAGGGYTFTAAYAPNQATITVSGVPALTDVIRNGGFAAGITDWQLFATPDASYISATVSAGALRFHRLAPPPGTTNQATVFQTTQAVLPVSAPIRAAFSLGNTSSARARVTVLVTDADFSDLAMCTFWLPPSSPLRPYELRASTTDAWTNAAVYFYGATVPLDQGDIVVDDVSLVQDPGLPSDRTVCIDPDAPSPGTNLAGPNLLLNGDFAAVGIDPWVTFGQIVSTVAAGTFQFFRPQATPAGVLLQATGQSQAAGEVLTATFDLGNSSPVRKRVTVIVHDRDFSDLSACTFWLPPGLAASPHTMRLFASQPWTDTTISVYAATVDLSPWLLFDNATLRRTPASTTTGTECVGP